MRIGVIDIGTNTMLLLVVDENVRPVVDLCRFARLGQGLAASGRLSDEAIARGLEVCREYRRVLDETECGEVHVVGTQALREAANRDAFLAPASEILRAKIEVIDGNREAALAFASVAQTFPALADFIVVDIGGGSTEIIHRERGVSVPIGAVRLTEQFLKHDPPTAAETRALFAAIDERLPTDLPRGVPIIATAGTATTLASLALRLRAYDSAAVTGYRLSSMALDAQLARLLTAKVAARREMAGMEAGRADVIAAGVAILSRLVTRLDASEVRIADRGVRWGLAYEVARKQ